jgi:hypothetical protein
MHPVSFDAAYQVERNRFTVFFRLIVAIPWILWQYVYGFAAIVVVLIAWFALMFTKRYPQWAYRFVSGYLRFSTRAGAFMLLLTDQLPPFSGKPRDDYPVSVDVGPSQLEYRRSRTFFKPLLAFPQQMLGSGAGGLASGAAFVTWWRVLFTGKQSITMHEGLRVGLAYLTRSNGYLMLLTEAHPRLLDLPPQEPPPDAPGILQPPYAVTGGPAASPAVPPPPAA